MNLEAQEYIHRVFMIDRKAEVELTAGSRKLVLIIAWLIVPGSRLTSYRLDRRPTGVNQRHQLWCEDYPICRDRQDRWKESPFIGLKLDWFGLSAIVLANSGMCALSGVVVGLVTSRFDWSLTATAATVVVIFCGQAGWFKLGT